MCMCSEQWTKNELLDILYMFSVNNLTNVLTTVHTWVCTVVGTLMEGISGHDILLPVAVLGTTNLSPKSLLLKCRSVVSDS